MDPVIIAAIITGASTLIATIIGCVTAVRVASSFKIKQNIKGDGNKTSSVVNSYGSNKED